MMKTKRMKRMVIGVGATESFGKDEQWSSTNDAPLQSGAVKKDEAGEGVFAAAVGFLLVGRSFAPSR